MRSAARSAHLGLASAALVLVSGLGILGSRAIGQEELPEAAPRFSLLDMNGQPVLLDSLAGRVVVLYFSSVRCPASNDYGDRFVRLARRHAGRDDVAFFAVETGERDQRPWLLEEVRVHRRAIGQEFRTLIDAGGNVARRFGVEVTPTVVVIDRYGRLRYRGSFDDGRNEREAKHSYCADALGQVLAGRTVTTAFTQAFGCAVRQPK